MHARIAQVWYNAMPQTKMHRQEFFSETFGLTQERFIRHCCNLGGLNTLPHLYLSWIKLLQDQKRCRYSTVPGGYVTVPVLNVFVLLVFVFINVILHTQLNAFLESS